MSQQKEIRDVIIRVNDGDALHSMAELRTASRNLRKEWSKAANSNDRARIAKDLKKVNGEISKLSRETRPATSGLSKLNKNFTALVGIVGGLGVLSVVSEQFSKLVQRSSQLSDALADVRKTTGLTEQGVKQLNKELSDIDTRSSRKELLALARDAGKLGISGVANVKKFVEQADIINVALGEDLGEGALVQIGKLSNVFKTEMLNIASSINTVGASSEANEAAMVSFLSRLGGVADTAKISAPEIIGYGATLDSLGVKVERGATALNNFFIEFVKDTEQFGQAAGFAQGELSKLVGEEGTNSGFVAFLENLKELNPESDQFLLKLESLGITSSKGAETFLALANNTDRLRTQQQIATESFKEGKSVIDEFNVKNNNLGASITRVTKAFNKKLMNSSLVKGMEAMFDLAADYMTVPLSEKMTTEQSNLNVLVAQINDSNISNEDRLKLIEELDGAYPNFLSHLDKENLSNEQLVKRLKEVNKEMINRIIIQRKKEDIDKQMEVIVDNQEKTNQRRLKLQQLLTAAFKKHGIELEANMSLEQQLQAVQDEIGERAVKTGKGKTATRNQEQRTLDELNSAMVQYNQTEAALQARIEEGNEIIKERDALMQQLGLNSDNDGSEDGDPDPKKPSGGGIITNTETTNKAVDETKALIEELKDVRLAAIDEVERHDIAALRLKFQRDKERVNNSLADEDVKYDLIRELASKLEEDITDIQAEAIDLRIKKANDSELLTLELAVDVAEDGSEEQLFAIQNLLGKQMQIELQNMELTEEQKTLILERFLKERAAMEQEFAEQQTEFSAMTFQQQMDVVSGYISQFGAIVQDGMNMAFDFVAEREQAQMDTFIMNQESQQRLLKKQLDDGIISQGKYNRKMQEMEEKRLQKERALKRKEFANKKAADTVSAIINTAVGVTAGLGAPWPLGIVFAALAGIMGAAEVAMISSQPNPYYKGGYTDVTDTEGNSHHAKDIGSFANGGYHSSASYGVVGEKGTELVIPNWMLNSPDYADSIGQIEQGIYRRNSSSSQPNVTTVNSDNSAASSNNDSTRIAAALEQNTAVMSKLMSEGVRSVWEHDNFENGIRQVEQNTGRHILSSSNNRQVGEPLT